jgi:hypothetical protein
MIGWLSAYGAPRAAEVLGRLPRHAWAIEPPNSDAATQTEQPTNVRLSNEVFHSLVILAAASRLVAIAGWIIPSAASHRTRRAGRTSS